MHRFGSYLNSHVHFHVLVTDGAFSAAGHGGAEFHPAIDLDQASIAAVQTKTRRRGLRWLHRHGHLDDVARSRTSGGGTMRMMPIPARIGS